MTLPKPNPGLVIRYSFLWSHEYRAGADEGTKDRPCAIVVALTGKSATDIRTIVAPITHSMPRVPDAAIEIPHDVCRSLGFDTGRHWICVDELNRFDWPGHDLRPLPGPTKGYVYGMLPPTLFARVRTAILQRQRARQGMIVPRD